MGQTLAEKLIARAAGKDAVRPGETVTVSIDLAMMHDSSGPRRFMPILERLGGGLLAEEEVCIFSTSRNFQGRMGAQSAKVYLGSPFSVAAAAVAGEIRDPREFLKGA